MDHQKKRKVEVFSAGCPACDETVQLVKQIACAACEVQVFDMNQPGVAMSARQYGIRRVPAVVIDGVVLTCCVDSGPTEEALRSAGLGTARS